MTLVCLLKNMAPKERKQALRLKTAKLREERKLNNKLIAANPYKKEKKPKAKYVYVGWATDAVVVVGNKYTSKGDRWEVI